MRAVEREPAKRFDRPPPTPPRPGRFAKVIPFRYSQTLEVTGTAGDTVFLAGSSRLPGFGTYEYAANATSRDFHATYQSRKDRGAFILRR